MRRDRILAVIIYILLLGLLLVAIELIPSVIKSTRSTAIITRGTIKDSHQVDLIVVRDEKVYYLKDDSELHYVAKEGEQIKVGQEIIEAKSVKIKEVPSKEVNIQDIKDDLKGKMSVTGNYTKKKGIFSTKIDGYENRLTFKKVKNLKEKDAEDFNRNIVDVKRSKAKRNSPVFKIVNNSKWQMVFWIDRYDAKNFKVDKVVTVKLNKYSVDARVAKIYKKESNLKIILESTRYHATAYKLRKAKATIVTLNRTGLIIPNEYIRRVKGKPGVYVINKTGDSEFVPISIYDTNGKESIVAEDVFYDKKGNIVSTVRNFDEVLTNPKR